jgi:hypothetical protein
MRPGQLRSLLKELRAGGVSEFSQETKAGTYSIKLGAAPTVVEQPSKASAKAAKQVQAEERVRLEGLAREMGVTVEQMREAASVLGN